MGVFVDWIVPFTVTVPTTTPVVVNPAVYVCVPPLCPKVNVPRLTGINALVIVLPLPVKFTFASTVAGRFKVVAVIAPCRSIKVRPSVKVTVVAPIVPVNLPVPTSRIVSVPTPATLVPLISAPAKCPVSSIRLCVTPVTAPIVRSATLIADARVSRTVSDPNVTAPKVMGVFVDWIVPFTVTVPTTPVVVNPAV